MDDAEFSRLLQAHMFGAATPEERQRLVAAALESSERALEFAQVEEIREDLDDPAFRRSLVESLAGVEPATAGAWWQQWLRPMFLGPLAAGAALTVVLLMVYDFSSRDGSTRIAEGPAPGAPSTAPAPSGTKRAAPGGDSTPGGTVTPAASDDASAAQMTALFALPVEGRSILKLTLSRASQYQLNSSVNASVTLPNGGRLYGMVQGPLGHLREVYPADPGIGDVLPAGSHEFSFTASGRLDPEKGGRFTLRVFVVSGDSAPSAGESRLSWLADRASVDEVTYEVVVP